MNRAAAKTRPGTGRDLPGQLRPLLALRWQMVRSARQRWLLVFLAALPWVAMVCAVSGFRQLPPDQAFNILLVTPTIYLAFVALAILVPLTSGGGYELFPGEQMLAYPIRARTQFFATLLLVPANLAWVVNVIGLVVLTTVTAGPVTWHTVPLLVSVASFVVMATVAGHAIGWTVVAVRQSGRGRVITWTLAGIATLIPLVLVHSGQAFLYLDRAPTRLALDNALKGYASAWVPWLAGVGLMVIVIVTASVLGAVATAWALRRPTGQGRLGGGRNVRRRAAPSTTLRTLLAADRASVWRAPALRRGLIVLLVLPGGVAMLAGLSWPSLVLLPGLVAAGAALLFGVNAFSLDASGAVWLSTLPGWANNAFFSKILIFLEVTALSVGAALLGGAVRAPAPTQLSQVVATVACGVAAAAVVVASGMRSSITRPHRAVLMGARDTPAPPGAMVGYSVKLATLCTMIGLLFSASGYSGHWWFPLLLAVPFLAWAGLSLIETHRRWTDPQVRSRVVLTVASG